MPSHIDTSQVEALRSGSQQAFTAIYRHYYDRIYFYCVRFIASETDAEDITADIFIQLWQRREQFDSRDAIGAFLHVAARNRCFDLLRHREMKAGHQAELLRLLEEQEDTPFYIEQLRIDLFKKILGEVDRLPPKMREIFLLSYQEGLKPLEIAARLQLSVQTVSNQKLSAIKVLRQALAGQPLLLLLLSLLESQHRYFS